MSECPHDLRDYVLDELSDAERREVEAYVASSPEAASELERLQVTQQAMTAVTEEEPPRRIAFVSDPVFEPSPGLRWWRAFWESAPRFALGAAALLAVVFGGIWATEPTLARTSGEWKLAFGGEPAQVAPVQDVGLRADEVRSLVAEVVAESAERQAARFEQILADQRSELDGQQRARMAAFVEDSTAALRLVSLDVQDLKYRLASRDSVAMNSGGGR